MDLLDKALKGNHRGLAKAISLIEDDVPEAEELIRRLYPHTGHAFIIGVTGPAGTGKSTLVDKMIGEYRKKGRTVGVIAVDPSSPFTGGALLGDRIRMVRHSLDEGVFIRSMASRGMAGGLASAAINAMRVLDASGRDVVIIETMGIGQTEVDVMRVVDITVVVLMPQLGDEIQSLKAGIMEIGDIYVINKADLEGADNAFLAIQGSLGERHGRKQLVLKTTATTGEDVGKLIEEIDNFQEYLAVSGLREKMQRERIEGEIISNVSRRFAEILSEEIRKTPEFEMEVEKVFKKKADPLTAIRNLLAINLIQRQQAKP